MVTTLEPKQQDPIMLVSPPEPTQPAGRAVEWRYSMPFPGVKYYAFRPKPAAREEPVVERYPLVETLAAELIDEWVFVL